jgi:hypothetical protein
MDHFAEPVLQAEDPADHFGDGLYESPEKIVEQMTGTRHPKCLHRAVSEWRGHPERTVIDGGPICTDIDDFVSDNSQFLRAFVHALYIFESQERGHRAAIRFPESGRDALMPPPSRT